MVMQISSTTNYLGAQRLFTLVTGIWVGSIFTSAYLVAPTIFNTLTDRQVAGMVAGSIFRVEALISSIVCIALMVLANLLINRGLTHYRIIRWLLLGILLCSLAALFIFIPWMNTLRDEALIQGMPVMLSPSAGLFSKLHGASSLVYLIQSALGLYLLWRLTKNHQ